MYLQLGLLLLQHFPEYLACVFLYFWVLKTHKLNIDLNAPETPHVGNIHSSEKAPFTCRGLGPVILWDGMLPVPGGTGGGGEGGASPLSDAL